MATIFAMGGISDDNHKVQAWLMSVGLIPDSNECPTCQAGKSLINPKNLMYSDMLDFYWGKTLNKKV